MLSVKVENNSIPHAPAISENSIPDRSSSSLFPVILSRQSNLSFHSTESEEAQDEMYEDQSHRIATTQAPDWVGDRSDEIIIDGVVVKVEELNKNQSQGGSVGIASYVFFLALLIMVIVVFTVTNDDNLSDSPESLNIAVPSDYEVYMREIAISVSGKEKVDDPNSTQYWLYHEIALELPKLLNTTELTEDIDKIVAQRYAVGVVSIEGMYHKEHFKPLLQEHIRQYLYGSICEYFLCNENNEILLYEKRNFVHTGYVGGILPPEIGHLATLNHLILSRNGFSGTIPTEVGNLKNLQVLDISDNFFTGTIPTEIGQLENLELFIFSSNSFDGSIPTEFDNLSNLVAFDVSNNNFTGVIPPLWKSRNSLIKVDLRNNSFLEEIGSLCNVDPSNKPAYSLSIVFNLKTVSYEIMPGFFFDCSGNQTEPECYCCDCN